MCNVDNEKKHVQDAATKLFDALDNVGYDGWLCVREQDDDARIRDWSFIAARSPIELLQLISHLVEFMYAVEDDNKRC